jgi:hypothetical protein
MSEAYAGGCFCGTVRWTAAGPPLAVLTCHCTMCRRAAGAPVVTWATFHARDVAQVRGAATWFRSSDRARRAFCAACGTPLFFQADRLPDEIDVTVGSFDRPEVVTPSRHIHVVSQVPWLSLDDGLPRHVEDSDSATLTPGSR